MQGREESFAWPCRLRIRRRADFVHCYEANNRYFSKYFVLFVRKQEGDSWRAGFTVSKKMGNAVRRNRIKRVLREFFRLHGKNIPKGLDIVVVPKKNLLGVPVDFALACRDITPVLKKICTLEESKTQ